MTLSQNHFCALLTRILPNEIAQDFAKYFLNLFEIKKKSSSRCHGHDLKQILFYVVLATI